MANESELLCEASLSRTLETMIDTRELGSETASLCERCMKEGKSLSLPDTPYDPRRRDSAYPNQNKAFPMWNRITPIRSEEPGRRVDRESERQ